MTDKPWKWEPCTPYAIGDIITAPNPTTLWDRIRMCFGFERKSPATKQMMVIGTRVGDLHPGWSVETFKLRNRVFYRLDMALSEHDDDWLKLSAGEMADYLVDCTDLEDRQLDEVLPFVSQWLEARRAA